MLPTAGWAQLAVEGNQFLTAEDFPGILHRPNAEFGTALATGDFDGDGKTDLAIGAPGQWLASVPETGVVLIVYGFSSSGWLRTESLGQASVGVEEFAEEYDHFGKSLAVGDFDGDGLDDLAVGVPHEDLALNDDEGIVQVFYGQAGIGLNGDRDDLFDRTSVAGNLEAGALFGHALTAGDFNGDGRDDLAIGVPYETVQGATLAGSVVVIYGGPGGLSVSHGADWWTQWHLGAVNGVDTAEDYDTFGWSLAAGDLNGDGRDELAVGAPGESYHHIGDGSLHVIFGTSLGLSNAGNLVRSSNIHNFAAQGMSIAIADLNGDGWGELIGGAPYVDVAEAENAGRFVVFKGLPEGLQSYSWTFSQWDAGQGIYETNDHFGMELVPADFNGDGYDDLAISAPGEQVGANVQSGAVTIFYGSAEYQFESTGVTWYQYTDGVEDDSDLGDHFGAALAVGHFEGRTPDLVVGVPEEDVEQYDDAGAVHLFYSEYGLVFADGFEWGNLGAWSSATN